MKTWKKTTRESAKTQDERAEGKRKRRQNATTAWVSEKEWRRNKKCWEIMEMNLWKIIYCSKFSLECVLFFFELFFLCWRVGIFICIFAALIIGFAQKLQKNYPSAGRFLRCSAQLNFIRSRKLKWVCEKFQIHFGPKKRNPENSPFWNSAW